MIKFSNFLKTSCLLILTVSAVASDRNEHRIPRIMDEAYSKLARRSHTLPTVQQENPTELLSRLEQFEIKAAYPQEDAEEQYQKGLLYRDGKIEGSQKDSVETMQWAGFYFQESAIKNHVKAMHNLAMIFYAREQYDAAAYWFAKAALQGFKPSHRNLNRLTSNEKAVYYLHKPNNPYQFTALSLPCKTAFYDFGIPNEILVHITKYLRFKDLVALTDVDKQWRAISQKELRSRFTLFDQIDYIQNKLMKEIDRGEYDSSFSLFESACRVVKKTSTNYFYLFLEQAAAVKQRKELSVSEVEGQEKETLEAWSPIFHALRQYSEDRVDQIISEHIDAYMTSRASFEDKIHIITLLNKPFLGSWPFIFKENNHYYNPSQAQRYLEDILSTLSEACDDYLGATRFVLKEVSPFNKYPDSSTSADLIVPAPLGEMVAKYLADTGNHWHKILYLAHYGEPSYVKVVFHDLLSSADVKELLKTEPDALDEAVDICQHVLGKDYSQNSERLLRDEDAIEFLRFSFSQPTAYNYIDPMVEHYLELAVDQIIKEDQLDEVYALFRILSHRGGFIPFFNDTPQTVESVLLEQVLGYDDPASQGGSMKSYLDRLERYLEKKGSYMPLFLSVTNLAVQNLTELTTQQKEIIKRLNEKKEAYETSMSSMGNSDDQYVRYFGGPYLSTGLVVFSQGILEVVHNHFSINSHTILEGPAYIKTREFTIQANFDVLEGAVIVAERFNLLGGKVWNPQNCHFIKVPKVKMDSSLQISQ